MKIKNYFGIYYKYVSKNIKTLSEYRIDFLIGIISVMFANIMNVLFIWVIFNHIPELNGWSFGQVLFIYGFASTAYGVWHTFLSGMSHWEISDLVRSGRLDRILLSPLSLLYHLIARRFDDDGLGDLMVGLSVLFISGNMIGMQWSLINILMMLFFILIGASILFSSFVIMSTFAFFIIKINSIAEVFFTLKRFIYYPIGIFGTGLMTILTFVMPLAFISYYPAIYFIGEGVWSKYIFLAPVIALLYFIIAYKFWKFGISKYTSTGS